MTGTPAPAVFVTGASRGIGLAAALEFARRGFAVALNSETDSGELEDARLRTAEHGGPAVKISGDVSDIARHEAMLNAAEEAIGPLSTLVNNAGVSVLNRGDLLDVTEESYDRCMAVNAKALFFLSQAFAKRLTSRPRDDGRFYSLINVTSSNVNAVAVQRAEYCASKAAAGMTSKAFAVRLGGEGIAVYDIQPGLIETAMTRPVIKTYQRRIEEEGLTVLPRLGQPEDVGRAAAALACGELPYTTGQTVSVDGGLLIPRF